jgi:hypothetical protein
LLRRNLPLAVEEVEFQVNEWQSFVEFVGLGVMNSIPMAETKTQIDCKRKTWRHAGSKRMGSATTAIRTASASVLTMALSAVMP